MCTPTVQGFFECGNECIKQPGTITGNPQALVSGRFPGNYGNSGGGYITEVGDKFSTEFIGRPVNRGGSEPDFKFLTLNPADLVF
jgi:hypothetical protein